ncbi:hypothetical protein [Nocardioides piscis]|uniref:RNA polymerase sigma factor 70 region 4 type 2 domain-containing protein n=1 Tax=Nocardioides piscis TaxID=2714938 RepID=A0A6G7YFR0_9ACTN|nr:hypothetical protein [Nocardioides piscis]QIK75506.1 hypothetical protein G7071_08685 [Nocardioides piscis]
MGSPETFDSFYAQTRDGLMLEAYALTGDLPAARTAVRDAFSVAWHHWRKVSRLDDPETHVRTLAYARAQRRHAARPWHREKGLDPAVVATLDSLSELTGVERKALVLVALTPATIVEIAREIGQPQAEAEKELRSAVAKFTSARGVPLSGVRGALEELAGPLDDIRWPRSTIVRRAGTARRRTHTLIGSVAATAALVVSGSIVASGGAEPTSLDEESALPTVAVRQPAPTQPAELDESALLAPAQVERYARGLDWAAAETSDNLAGSGLVMPCQQARFADPAGVDALVRTFSGTAEVSRTRKVKRKGRTSTKRSTSTEQQATAVEILELSTDAGQARSTYLTARSWFAGCIDARAQLISTDTVSRVGDEATVMRLRTWNKKPAEVTVGVARSGRLTVTTMVRSTRRPVDSRTAATALAAAVNAACGETGSGVCAGPPKVRARDPFSLGRPAGLLQAVDLPPVSGAVGPWVGTDPERARKNYASTRCDNIQFREKGMKHSLTRTFVFPQSKLDTFGLTHTVASLPTQRAKAFVGGVRERIRKCGEASFGTTVDTLVTRSSKHTDLTVWDLGFEISDRVTIQFWMAIMRDGNAVSQLGFTPSDRMTMRRDDFVTTAERALERLSDLPSAKR